MRAGGAPAGIGAPTRLHLDAGAVTIGALDYGMPTGIAGDGMPTGIAGDGMPTGIAGDAPTVLTVHGFADSAWSLDPIARSLADRYRVVSLDLRGHGHSDWGPYTLLHLVGDLVGVCEALELDRPLLVGHSMGGQAVAQCCGLYPELVGAAVLVEALGPPPRLEEREDPIAYERSWSRNRVELVRRRAEHRPLRDLDDAERRFRRANPGLDPARARFLVELNTVAEPDGTRRWRHDPAARDWLAGHDHDRAEQRWGGARCPVLVIQGADAWERFWSRSVLSAEGLDGPMSPEETARRVGLLGPRAELVEIADAGHMIHYDQPAELARIVGEFLDRVAP